MDEEADEKMKIKEEETSGVAYKVNLEEDIDLDDPFRPLFSIAPVATTMSSPAVVKFS